MTQKQFYKSKAWAKARASFIAYRQAIDGGLCQTCGVKLGYIVHHKIWLNDINCNDPNISLNLDNLAYECLECHNKERDPERIPGRCYYDSDGNLIPK